MMTHVAILITEFTKSIETKFLFFQINSMSPQKRKKSPDPDGNIAEVDRSEHPTAEPPRPVRTCRMDAPPQYVPLSDDDSGSSSNHGQNKGRKRTRESDDENDSVTYNPDDGNDDLDPEEEPPVKKAKTLTDYADEEKNHFARFCQRHKGESVNALILTTKDRDIMFCLSGCGNTHGTKRTRKAIQQWINKYRKSCLIIWK